jgi:hypothetical protein
MMSLRDGSKLLQDELLPKKKEGLFAGVLHLVITAGGMPYLKPANLRIH